MQPQIHRIKLGINSCYLIREKSVIMIDGGNPGKLKAFKRKITELGIAPEEIKLIILTHSHFDHAGSAKEISDYTGAKIVLHSSEVNFTEGNGMIVPKGVNTWGKITQPVFFPVFRRLKFPGFDPHILIDEPEFSLNVFGVKGKIIHTPGHTPGSISVLLDSGDAFVGCMAHDGIPFRLRPGLPIYACDIEELKRSWGILMEKGARRIYPGHGKPFGVEEFMGEGL